MSAALRLLGLLLGMALLFPGLCSLGFMVALLPETLSHPNASGSGGLLLLWGFTFLLGWGGIALVRWGLREEP